MIQKVLIGGLAAALLGLLIVSKLLLAAQEAKGALEAEIENAGQVNDRQKLVIEAIQAEHTAALEAAEKERQRARKAEETIRVIDANAELEREEFFTRLQAARSELTDAERNCARQPIPAAYIASMWGEDAGN